MFFFSISSSAISSTAAAQTVIILFLKLAYANDFAVAQMICGVFFARNETCRRHAMRRINRMKTLKQSK